MILSYIIPLSNFSLFYICLLNLFCKVTYSNFCFITFSSVCLSFCNLYSISYFFFAFPIFSCFQLHFYFFVSFGFMLPFVISFFFFQNFNLSLYSEAFFPFAILLFCPTFCLIPSDLSSFPYQFCYSSMSFFT